MDYFDAEMAYGHDIVEAGRLEQYHEAVDAGYGPQFAWMGELETGLQLSREYFEALLDGDLLLEFQNFQEKEHHMFDIRMCEVFMKGVWYERKNPGVWPF